MSCCCTTLPALLLFSATDFLSLVDKAQFSIQLVTNNFSSMDSRAEWWETSHTEGCRVQWGGTDRPCSIHGGVILAREPFVQTL